MQSIKKDLSSLSWEFLSCDADPPYGLLCVTCKGLGRRWRVGRRGASGKDTNMKFMLFAMLEVIKSFVSALGVSSLPVSMEMYQAKSLACKWDKVSEPFQFLTAYPHLSHLICYSFPCHPCLATLASQLFMDSSILLPHGLCTCCFQPGIFYPQMSFRSCPNDTWVESSFTTLFKIALPPVNRWNFANLMDENGISMSFKFFIIFYICIFYNIYNISINSLLCLRAIYTSFPVSCLVLSFAYFSNDSWYFSY